MVLVELLVAPLWSVVGPCEAATLTVCPSGCDHTEIQHAATVATAGDVIQLLSVTPHTEGDIFITKDLTVEGFGQSTTVIQADAVAGASTVPVFVVVSGATISFSDLVIRHGGGSQGGAISVLDGTAIFDDVTLAINHGSIGGAGYVASGSSLVGYHLTVTGNTASIGGGIASEGSVMLVNSEVSSNEAQTGDGGGINATAGELELNGTLVEWNYVDSAVPSDFVYGPGVYFFGDALEIRNSVIRHNTSSSNNVYGGGPSVRGFGTARIESTEISSNQGHTGGGIYASIPDLSIVDTTLASNTASGGGGMYVSTTADGASLTVRRCTVSGNSADVGGAGFRFSLSGDGASFAVVNSTISGNDAAGDGGGLKVDSGHGTVASSTITANTADADANNSGDAGGIWIGSSARLKLKNSIVAGNTDLSAGSVAPDCSGAVESVGYNFIGSLGVHTAACVVEGDTTGNVIGADPWLAPLADNGGPTCTHAIDGSSTAVNAGNPLGCTDEDDNLLWADQRSWQRPDTCDVGSFEFGAVEVLIFNDGFESAGTSAWSSVVPEKRALETPELFLPLAIRGH